MKNHKLLQSNGFKLVPGMFINEVTLQDIQKEIVNIPDTNQIIHLQFRRFAGCPICNLHLQSFIRRHKALQDAGIKQIVIFHSSKEELSRYAKDFPFTLIADPEKKLYQLFGVTTSVWSLLSPKSYTFTLKSIYNSLIEYLRGRRPLPPFSASGGSFGLPADFLISTTAKLIDCSYGRHASDHWSVDTVLQKVEQYQSNLNLRF